MELKYASDLKVGDRIVDKKTGLVVVLDAFGEHIFPKSDTFTVYGYFEESGDDWTRELDDDSQVRVVVA